MPVAAVLQPTINNALGAPGSQNYEHGKSAVAHANNLLAAVEAGGLLDGLSAAQKAEVRDILQDMPADVDSQFMAAVRGALDNDQKVRFNWTEHPTNGYDYAQSTRPDGTIVLTLRTRRGTAE